MSNLFFESAFTFINRLFYYLVSNHRPMKDLNKCIIKFVDVIIRSNITKKVSVHNMYKGMFSTAIPFESILFPLRLKLIKVFSEQLTYLTQNHLIGSLFSGFITGFALNAALTPLSKIVINLSIIQDFPKNKVDFFMNNHKKNGINHNIYLKLFYKHFMFFGFRGGLESLVLAFTFGMGLLYSQKNRKNDKQIKNLAKFEITQDQELLTRLIEAGYIKKTKNFFKDQGSFSEQKVVFFTSIITGVFLGISLGITDTILLSYKKIHDPTSIENLNFKVIKEMLLPGNFRILKYICGIYWLKWEIRFLAYAGIDTMLRKYKII